MAETAPYLTVDGPGKAALEVRGSRFRGLVGHVATVEAAEAFVGAVADDHPDATHVVPAYRVRVGSGRSGHLLREWSSDAGEPAGSAGKPAETVLARRDLENVVAAVVRHYGGTDLGVGGLARAYGRAVSLAVDDAGVVERRPRRRLVVEVAYDDSGTVRGLLEAAGVEFDAAYEASVRFDAHVPADEADALADRLRSATRGRAEVAVDGDGRPPG